MTRAQAVDMDSEDNIVILIGYGGVKRALDRQAILNFLALEANGRQFAAGTSGRSLTSLGKILMPIYQAGKLGKDDAATIKSILSDFDGNVGGKRSAQAGHMLRVMLSWRSVPADLRGTVTSFLDGYPELERIPKRGAIPTHPTKPGKRPSKKG